MKKQLLKESEVRKLMKFANIGALSDTFVSRLSESEMMEAEHEDEEAPAPPMDAMGDDPEGDPAAAEADPMAMDDEAPGLEEPAAAAAGEVPADLATVVKSELIPAMNAVVSAASGGKVTDVFDAEVEGEGMDDAPMDDAPMGDEPMDDAPMDAAPMDDAPLGAAPEGEEEADLEEDLVNEVARRVARRLTKLRSR